MKKDGVLQSVMQSPLSRRQLLKGAVSTAAVVSASSFVGSSYAQSQSEVVAPRLRASFDLGWKFIRGDFPGAQMPEFSDSAWRALDLPHDWSIEGPFGEKEPSSFCGAYLPTGIGWYRKRFRLPDSYADSYKDKKLTIEFDGVYQNSEVWINGQWLGKRPYGYVPFFYDLTPHINFGKENVVAVRVDNSHQTNCRWYSGSGIYRHTWLLSTNKVHVAPWALSSAPRRYRTTPQRFALTQRSKTKGKRLRAAISSAA
jgi:beta-galactosidase